MVVLPRDEWECIKSMLSQVKDTLQEKLEDEVNSQWIESKEARKMLGVSAKTWQSYRDRRALDFSQIGRKIYVRRADLEAFLQKHTIRSRQSQERR